MRYLVLALMIVLLPLRGWMGDAMATGMAISMATGVATTTKTIAAGAHKTNPDGHFEHQTSTQAAPATALQAHPDCAGHASGETSPSLDSRGAQDDHCKPCQSCQACHTVALTPSLPDIRPAFDAPFTPRAIAVEFTSALAAMGQKPPIF